MPLSPILTLTLATFAIGTTELATQGLLLEISTDLNVSIPDAGLLVTGYALGVAIGGPILAILTYRLPRKTALLALMGLFVVGHVLCAVAPTYALLMLARVVSSFCHGAFFGIGSVVAASLVPPDRRASAIALMWAGIAASNILGVPAGTALGQAFGWRSTFWAVTRSAHRDGRDRRVAARQRPRRPDQLANEFKVLAKPQVLLALALTVLICAATFSVFTFIAPLLIETTGILPAALPFYLLLFGLGGVIGMQAGGRFADWNPMASIVGVFLANVVADLMLLVALHGPDLREGHDVSVGFCVLFHRGANPDFAKWASPLTPPTLPRRSSSPASIWAMPSAPSSVPPRFPPASAMACFLGSARCWP